MLGVKVIPTSPRVEPEGKVLWDICEADQSVLKLWPVRGAQIVARGLAGMGQGHNGRMSRSLVGQGHGWGAAPPRSPRRSAGMVAHADCPELPTWGPTCIQWLVYGRGIQGLTPLPQFRTSLIGPSQL